MSKPPHTSPDRIAPVTKPWPTTLFRFGSPDGLKSLVDGTLKFTPPSEFNDPFEFLPGIDPNLGDQPPTRADFKNALLKPHHFARWLFRHKFPNGSAPNYRAWVEQWSNEHPGKWSRWCERIDCARRVYLKKISLLQGVACFAQFSNEELQRPDVVRQWAHYADEHRGIAIEFDLNHEFFNPWRGPEWLFEVRYLPHRTAFGFTDLDDFSDEGMLSLLRKCAKVKSDAWKGENEWRLIVPLGVPVKSLPIRRVVDGEGVLHLVPLWESCAGEEEKSRRPP